VSDPVDVTVASEASEADMDLGACINGGALIRSERLGTARGLIPGNLPAGSARDTEVTRGSIDTAERTGKTRSIEPGLRVAAALSEPPEVAGDSGPSLLPVKMFT